MFAELSNSGIQFTILFSQVPVQQQYHHSLHQQVQSESEGLNLVLERPKSPVSISMTQNTVQYVYTTNGSSTVPLTTTPAEANFAQIAPLLNQSIRHQPQQHVQQASRQIVLNEKLVVSHSQSQEKEMQSLKLSGGPTVQHHHHIQGGGSISLGTVNQQQHRERERERDSNSLNNSRHSSRSNSIEGARFEGVVKPENPTNQQPIGASFPQSYNFNATVVQAQVRFTFLSKFSSVMDSPCSLTVDLIKSNLFFIL